MMRVVYLSVVAALLTSIATVSARGQASAPPADKAGEAYYHLSDADFKPSEVPNWVWESPVQTFDMSGDDTDIKRSAAMGVNVLHNHGIKPYWPLKRDDPKSGVESTKAADAKHRIDLAHSLGIRYCYGVYPWAPIALLKQHPEWTIHREDNDKIEQRVKAELGDSIAMDEYEKLGQLCVMCFNSPYADYYIDCLTEIVRDLKIDGISFDGNYHPRVCYCKSCKEKYRRDTGKEIPAKVDVNDVEYRKYLVWASDQHEAFFVRMHQRLREVNPEFAIMSWTVNAGRWMQLTSPPEMSRRMNMVLDCPLQEWWLDECHRGPTVVPAFGAAYGWAITDHRCAGAEAYAMSHMDPYGTDSFPEHEAVRRSMLVLTNGSFCPVALCHPFAETTVKEIAKRAKWQVRAQPHRWAAVLMSEQTRVNYGLTKMEERCLPFPLGVFRAAYEEHLPMTIITEWDLRPEALAKYAVVVLPNAACLSDGQMAAIRQYVADGGGLVATCDTSLFDEIGRPRPNFGLADLFGVKYLGQPGEAATPAGEDFSKRFDNNTFWNDFTSIAALNWANSPLHKDAILSKLCPGGQSSFKGRVTRVSEPANEAAKLATVCQSGWGGKTYKIGQSPLPGVVMNQFGKGRVIYLAAGVDGAYYSYSYPYERSLMAQAMNMVASRAASIKVDAPKCVQATYFEQTDAKGRRILVHLFNDLNTTSNHGDPTAESPLREETIPISGIKIHFDGYRVKQFHVEPEGKTLKATTSGNIQTVEAPTLEMHSILVAELEPDQK